jgi:mRNA-degrading endonuclease RelE of RelBE toxin-antitoxin system
MKIVFDEDAHRDLKHIDRSQILMFYNHAKKIAEKPPGRHLKHGLPFYVEEVGQGRIVYQVKNDTVFIIRCFATHKDYERWYKS